jgi:transketolase
MRRVFVETLCELAAADPRIVLLTGDLGFMALEPFSDRYPDRFINVGVAEQNMVGIATGLAEAGFVPYVYSIVTFATLRPYEFIRNGPIVHHLPVRIIGMGGGFEYGTAGVSHFGLEDVGVMRTQPDIVTIAPADGGQARTALLATASEPGPVYYRLSKDDASVVPGLDGRFDPERVEMVRPGDDVLLLTMGPVAVEAVKAAEALEADGIRCGVGVVSTLNPAPTRDLLEKMRRVRAVVTVEAHYVNGGLGSMACEVAASHGLGVPVLRQGLHHTPVGPVGGNGFMQEQTGLSREGLMLAARRAVQLTA